MNRQLLLLALFFCALQSNAQEIKSFYFNDQFQPVNDTLAPISGIARRQGIVWEMLLVEAATGKKLMYGYYDSSLTMPVGPCTYYHLSGGKRMAGTYHEGEEIGLWRTWNEDGQLLDSSTYVAGEPVISYNWVYDDAGILQQYSFRDTSGNKEHRTYAPTGQLTLESKVNGKAVEMRSFTVSGQLEYEYLVDAKGKVIKDTRQAFIAAKAKAAKENAPLEPEYMGGDHAFQEYINKAIHVSEDRYNITLTIEFDLNERGTVQDVRFSEVPESQVRIIIQNALRRMNSWVMHGYKKWTVRLKLTL
ncbi:MAG: hypothetical protein EOO15_12485 [Chitinophagaceae bacterium]|nr:MAG: hypothetical protein EOO15_12485 [Chitinophagaceae bacterium]